MAIWVQEALAAASVVVFVGSILVLATLGEVIL
jgi:hypothetical protein